MEASLLIVDASVVAKWLLPEPDRLLALRLQERYRSGEVTLLAPRVLLAEVGNALWKRVLRGDVTSEVAQLGFEQLCLDPPKLVDSNEVMLSALQLALLHRQTIYDCLYLALALERLCRLVTADEKFFRATSTVYPFVRLLRDF